MDYLIFRLPSDESESGGKAHVFTRAYRATGHARNGVGGSL